ncbi:MAG: dehydrogenase, partial [Cyclobacteriaceae bacterium]|nr:dehydrogenase [Cyclobacteriaceae bacterium]
HIKGCMNKVAEHVVGTEGTAELQGNTGIIRDLKGNVIYNHRDREDPNPFQVEHDELFASIRKGEVMNNFRNGVESTLTTILGRYATYSGQMVTREEVLNSSIQLMPAAVDWNTPPPVMPDGEGYYPVAMPGVFKVI